MTEDQAKIAQEASKKPGFDNFMKLPTIRLLISTVPAGDKPETLETLLQEAFDSGYNRGCVDTSLMLLKAMFDPKNLKS